MRRARPARVAGGGVARVALVACAACVVHAAPALPAAGARLGPGLLHAQSLLERPPNMAGTWAGESGTLEFHFLHRFQATPAPARKVLNSPTFLLAAGLPRGAAAGARYATNSLVRPGFPNEWELFARAPLLAGDAAPVELLAHAAWNQAARSFDGELTAARELGAVRLLAAVRGFSDAYHRGASRVALAGGAMLRLHPNLALAADVASLLAAEPGERAAWGAGVQLRIPLSPHTLSLHASNANATTLQSASRGSRATLWGFEFTVPVTLRRYSRGRPPPAAPRPAAEPDGSPALPAETTPGARAAPADTGRIAAEVGMTDRLLFTPDTVRIRAGQAVRWVNTSVMSHTVTADPAQAARPEYVALPAGARPFDSGDMDPGDVFVHTFTVRGTYRYVCLPHQPVMAGVVIVE
jgi:plastocyanin